MTAKQQFEASCELCDREAALYCAPDAAFLCWSCDAVVHGANFLATRHVRCVPCSSCHSLDPSDAPRVTGLGRHRPLNFLCRSCRPDPETSPSSPTASANSCLSTSESASGALAAAAKRRRRREERVDERMYSVLACWSRRMGLRARPCVAVAARTLGECRREIASLPLRVSLAGALWFSIRLCGGTIERDGSRESTALRRLEACSGVPSRLICFAESRIARSPGRVQLVKERWADSGECS